MGSAGNLSQTYTKDKLKIATYNTRSIINKTVEVLEFIKGQ